MVSTMTTTVVQDIPLIAATPLDRVLYMLRIAEVNVRSRKSTFGFYAEIRL